MKPNQADKAENSIPDSRSFIKRIRERYNVTDTQVVAKAFELIVFFGIPEETSVKLAVKEFQPKHTRQGRPLDPTPRFQDKITVRNNDIILEASARAAISGKPEKKERHLLINEILTNYTRSKPEPLKKET